MTDIASMAGWATVAPSTPLSLDNLFALLDNPPPYESPPYVLHPSQFAALQELAAYERWREWRTTQPWYRKRGPKRYDGAGFLRFLLPARNGRKRDTVRRERTRPRR